MQIIGIAYRSREGVYTMFALRYHMTPCLQTSREIASVNRPLVFLPGLYISRGLTFKSDNPRLPHGEISMLHTIFRLMFHKHLCLFLHVRTVQPRGYRICYHGCENIYVCFFVYGLYSLVGTAYFIMVVKTIVLRMSASQYTTRTRRNRTGAARQVMYSIVYSTKLNRMLMPRT